MAWNYRKGELDRAIADFNEAIRLRPDFATFFTGRGLAYNDKGEHDRAIADYDEAIRLDPGNALAFDSRGDALRAEGELDRAIADYGEAIRLDPDNAGAFFNRGLAYGRKGEHDRAVADFDEAIRLDPEGAAAFNNRGAAYSAKGELDRAIADYDAAIRLDPEDAAAFFNRGIAHGRKGEHDRAIADYDEAVRLDPGLAKAFYGRGLAYQQKGDLRQAARDYRQALTIDPELSSAQYRLARVERSPTLVRQAQENLTELGFNTGSVDGVLGARTRAAVTAFQKAEDLQPDGKVTEPLLTRLEQALAEEKAAPPDATPPMITVAERLETKNARVSVEGKVTDDRGPVRLTLDGDEVQVGRDGTFRVGVGMSEIGTIRVALLAEDGAGNQAERTVTIVRQPPPDTTPPVITVAERLETDAEEVSVEGRVTDDRGPIILLLDGREVEVGREGRFRAAVAVPKVGTLRKTLRARDDAGNTAERMVTIVRLLPPDTTPPVITVAERLETERAGVSVEGTATDDRGPVRLTLDGDEVQVGRDGSFQTAVTVPIGETSKKLRVRDAAGNHAERTVTILRRPQERRVALVIGNSDYRHMPELSNPANDARAVTAALRRLGFEVTEGIDLDRSAMVDALIAFGRSAEKADDALVFYAGHGVQVDGQNYLLPVDAWVEDERDLRRYVTADHVIRDAAGARRVALVVLDACRDNPITRSLKRRMSTRSLTVGRGLARPGFEPPNTLIAYATEADDVAADGTGDNSPYTTALLKYLEEPGLEVVMMFRKVRDAVAKATDGKQVPSLYSSLGGTEIYLAGAES